MKKKINSSFPIQKGVAAGMGVGRTQLSMLTNMNVNTLKSHVGQSQDWSTRNFNEQIIKIMLSTQMINTGRGAMKVYLVIKQ